MVTVKTKKSKCFTHVEFLWHFAIGNILKVDSISELLYFSHYVTVPIVKRKWLEKNENTFSVYSIIKMFKTLCLKLKAEL